MDETARAVREILGLVQGTAIADLEVEWDGTSVRLKREPARSFLQAGSAAEPSPADDAVVVRSAYVGLFHREPAGEFPSVGDAVSAGQTVAHVETLRIQNTVTAPADGTIVEVLVADRTPVEYGQPLLVIRPDHA